MAPPIRKTNFVPEWIDMRPKIPVPRIDWIEDKRLDIAYGDHPLQRYDLYYPARRGEPLPVLVVVHGGGFTHMDKRDWHLYPGFFALREGFALVSVNYRLAPRHPYPNGQNDVRDAILHIKRHAREWALDAERIFLYGTSAGGNFASVLGLKAHNERAEYTVRGFAALCPVISFVLAWEGITRMPRSSLLRFAATRICRQYFGALPPKADEAMRQASAESYIGDTIPAIYLQQGTADPLTAVQPLGNLVDMLSKASNAGPDNLVLDMLDGAGHAGGGPDFLEERNILPIIRFFQKQQ